MANLDELKKYNFSFSKKFGQNFIFDTNLLESITKAAGIDNTCNVLEIGTGAGTLTTVLASKANKVVSYEIDTSLQSYLLDKFNSIHNVEIIFEDILKVPTSSIDDKFQNGYHIVANLPYYITTPIIFKFIEESKNLKTLTIMVQQEVAERLIAKEGTANYGAITASIATIGEVKIIKKISRNMFTPAPNVDSAIVQITITPNKYNIKNMSILKQTIKSAFQMRRKTLANNLKSTFGLDTNTINEILQQLHISPNARGETLSAQQFVDLANILAQK